MTNYCEQIEPFSEILREIADEMQRQVYDLLITDAEIVRFMSDGFVPFDEFKDQVIGIYDRLGSTGAVVGDRVQKIKEINEMMEK
jgi:hypothetical protein